MSKDTSIDLNSKFAPKQQEQPQKQQETSKAVVNWNEVFTEWCYKIPKGYPTIVDGVFTEYEEVKILNEILEEKFAVSMPLPEAKPKIKVEYTKGVKNTTHTKEGFVMYFASLPTNLLKQAEDKLRNGTAVQLKLPTDYVKDVTYGSSKDTISNIKLLNTTKLPFQTTDKEHYINGITSAKYIQQMYGGPVPSNLIDRGEFFYKIRERAIVLLADTGIKLSQGEQDKWCPGDIYIYATNPPTDLTLLKYLNQANGSLNGLFMDTFSKPNKLKPILAVSLKEEEARAGKATSFMKVLEKEKDYPKANNLNRDMDRLKDVVTQLNAFRSKIKKESDMQSGYGELSDAYKSLIRLTDSKQFGNAATELLPILGDILAKVVGKQNLAIGKDKVKKLERIKLPSTKTLQTAALAISTFINTTYDSVYAAYATTNKNFVDTLQQGTYDIEAQKVEKSNDGEKDVANKIELLLKKANCYIVADDLVENLATKLSIPKAFKTLAKEKNPFIALAAFGMSQAGISPTFFKLIGKGSLDAKATLESFPSDGIVRLSPRAKVKVIDTRAFKGVRVVFRVSQFQGKKRLHDYEVDLGFLYSGTQFKIEINRIQ
ncbi:hypothetical protein UFOVP450_2 [uncultured Caudovirales phage]|uniref:Uncharacterized protein n=1 Tax=uncultured Caudovirales phage TaxID=2100421 RepID=A0A6J5M6T3_9CAUD|nr:hypothetical protein UFOVP450_2 [uncultured Caudovirales phage]